MIFHSISLSITEQIINCTSLNYVFHYIILNLRLKESVIMMKFLHYGLFIGMLVLLVGCGQVDNNHATPNNSNEHNNMNNQNETEMNNNEEENNTNNTNNIEENEDTQSILKDADPSIVQLVNKENELGPDDHPTDLVTIDVVHVLDNPEVNQLRKEAADALSKMFEEAKNDDVLLYARSGFRSYQTQEELFSSYVNQHGMEAANRFSARPGQSEHQTGLVMDITSKQVDFALTEDFGETPDGIWLRDNAHRFGFIIRYPEGKEEITGYTYEPWHVRYLGEEVATAVFESGLTYEEFIEAEEGK